MLQHFPGEVNAVAVTTLNNIGKGGGHKANMEDCNSWKIINTRRHVNAQQEVTDPPPPPLGQGGQPLPPLLKKLKNEL